jgi:hypothetical protein
MFTLVAECVTIINAWPIMNQGLVRLTPLEIAGH